MKISKPMCSAFGHAESQLYDVPAGNLKASA